MKIDIVYIAIGEYEQFWDIFYPSCQTFFCVDAEKNYELFTDSQRLFNLNYPNVTVHKVPDKGFIINVSSKSKFMLSIERQLQQYDYIFYLNGNFRFLSPIWSKEVISETNNFKFTALSFDELLKRKTSEYPYDRNPKCGAYIPPNIGKRYYQGGFFGGSFTEMMNFNRWASRKIEKDLKKGIIARFHDESYLNKYLIDKTPHIINNKYAYYPQTTYKGEYKAELIDKTSFWGKKKTTEIRKNYFSYDYSFLFKMDAKFNKLGVVKMQGGLGNQMFIYSFYLYLKEILKLNCSLLIDLTFYESLSCHNGFELLQHFKKIDHSFFLSQDLKKKISLIPKSIISEEQVSTIQKFKHPRNPITIYDGYWQCFHYIQSNEIKIKELFRINENRLNTKSLSYLKQIRKTNSVGIHIRRGDYLHTGNNILYINLSSTEYYIKAIEKITRSIVDKPVLYLFSDDIEWAKSYCIADNTIIVDIEENGADWQDMFLMSQCKHNIISNSSFAWWSAWLNPNPDKIIIAPDSWYCGVDVPHLIPEDWIKVGVDIQLNFRQKLAAQIFLNDSLKNTPGLLGGKMGMCIFFFRTGRILEDNRYTAFAENLLEDIFNMVSVKLPLDFNEYGLLGIAYGFQYLIAEGFAEGDANNILSEVDNQLLYYIDKNKSISLSIILDLIIYFTKRIEYNLSIENHEIKKVFFTACKELVDKIKAFSPKEIACNDSFFKCLLDLQKIGFSEQEIDVFLSKNLDNLDFRTALLKGLLSSMNI